MKEYTAEQLASRISDLKEIENTVSRYAFLTYYKRYAEALSTLWVSPAAVPTLTANDRRIEGYDAVKAFLVDEGEEAVLADNAAMRALFPEELAGKADSEIWGVGSAVVHTITTPLIELAGDQQTAKGMWYSVGQNTDIDHAKGPVAYWNWEKYALDLKKEDGKWKIWHLIICTDFKSQVGRNWADSNIAPSGDYYKAYDTHQTPQDYPPMPEPYETFAETFSY